MDSLFSLFIIIVPVGFIIWWIRKKKNGTNGQGQVKKRHEGDEVWRTIKDFLKNNDEKGKEIVESYVAKRPDPYVINRSLPKAEQKLQKIEIEKRKKEEKAKKEQFKKEGKKYTKEKPRELYVVLFVTRNPKTKVEDKPRAIECEVKNVRKPGSKSKKDLEKKIIILGERDYDLESKWILPIKTAEETRIKKEYEKQQKMKKINPFSIISKKRQEKINNDPKKLEQQNKKIEEKERKKQEKKERENAKWEKKETVIKTKK